MPKIVFETINPKYLRNIPQEFYEWSQEDQVVYLYKLVAQLQEAIDAQHKTCTCDDGGDFGLNYKCKRCGGV